MKRFNFFLAAAALIALAAACATPVVSEAIDPSEPDNTAYNYEVAVDATDTGDIIPNVVSNINVWNMNQIFVNPSVKSEYNIFDFVEYVQLMTATGGEPSRDLFKDPSDKTILDDYDFTNLIENCRGILSLGAKPHIKFGNVPSKFTKNYAVASFHVNVYAPEDYEQYYKYIRAIVEALVAEFGKDELLCWHYGVLTEYENKSWFCGTDGTPENAQEEYCKLYDWTVQALIDVIGQDGLYVGAHSMTNYEGLWDERNFIRHCAEGTNWANGGKGSYITYLSASIYDYKPGVFTTFLDLVKCIKLLKEAAESYGLTGLAYGVDEGRILGAGRGSETDDLHSRTVGQTFMAAYDARLYTQLLDLGGSYISSWQYLSKDYFEGNPSVSYHVASNIARFAGGRRACVSSTEVSPIQYDATAAARRSGVNIPDDMAPSMQNAEINALASVDPVSGKTSVMLYNFANDIAYADTATVKLTVKTALKAGLHSITISKIGDDCNWFDEWIQDRKELGITDDMFKWSPDDACCVALKMSDSTTIAKYNALEATKYPQLCRLVPKTGKVRIADDGTLALRCPLGGSNVWFIEIQ